jgi:hypothetical protein
VTSEPVEFAESNTEQVPVGAFVCGPTNNPRLVVDWRGQYRAAHELDETFDSSAEQYLSAYYYPRREFCRYVVTNNYSVRSYSGPAGCPFLTFDIDRADNLDAALHDTRSLLQFLDRRFGPKLEDGIGVYYSGRKGFHIAGELLPAFSPSVAIPGICRRLAEQLATAAGIVIDTSIYDRTQLLRLPNSRHPATGLFKRFLTRDELFHLDADRIRELARHPAGYPMPSCGEQVQELDDAFASAAKAESSGRVDSPSSPLHPVLPKYVRDFIGFADVQEPGRAVTLFRCAAALSEAGTPPAVVFGLLEEVALKTGLEAWEVEKQIRDGIRRGTRAGEPS